MANGRQCKSRGVVYNFFRGELIHYSIRFPIWDSFLNPLMSFKFDRMYKPNAYPPITRPLVGVGVVCLVARVLYYY